MLANAGPSRRLIMLSPRKRCLVRLRQPDRGTGVDNVSITRMPLKNIRDPAENIPFTQGVISAWDNY